MLEQCLTEPMLNRILRKSLIWAYRAYEVGLGFEPDPTALSVSIESYADGCKLSMTVQSRMCKVYGLEYFGPTLNTDDCCENPNSD